MCKLLLFHLVVGKLCCKLDGSLSEAADFDDAEVEANMNNEAARSLCGLIIIIMTNDLFNLTMVSRLSLGKELLALLKKENEDEGAKKETNWF